VWDSHLGWTGLGRVKRLGGTPDVIAMPIVPHTSYSYREVKIS
jgi:hypothetical protein